LMVGMGMPRQEHWVLDHLDTLPNCPILTCGACFEYIAGVQRTPPRWMGRIGLEWLARLVMDPRRLWRRYLLEPLSLIRPVAQEKLRARANKR
jgi:N-acetylglucosaminyldiphosphoundecaprenol N-acetyl-beta-D-mannosaminyltransferase